MKSVLGVPLTYTLGLGFAIASTFMLANTAIAQPEGLQGSYIGVTVDSSQTGTMLKSVLETDAWGGVPAWSPADLWKANITTGNLPGTAPTSGENQFQGRLDIPSSQVSARGTVFFVDKEVKAVMPMISYDLPITDGTNIYAGAGYALVKNPGTPLGDRDGLVLSTGIEAGVGDGLVIYGDAKLRLNRDRANPDSPVRVQVGAGYRF